MNWLRTVFGFLAGIGFLQIVISLLGCSVLPNGTYDCSVSTWIPIQYQGVGALALMMIAGLMKAFGQGGTPIENLFRKSVVVTPEAKPGTVTEEQVKKS